MKADNIVLSDEEIRKIRIEIYDDPTLVEDLIGQYDRAIAEAQLKKVVKDIQTHSGSKVRKGRHVREMSEDYWQSLLEEL